MSKFANALSIQRSRYSQAEALVKSLSDTLRSEQAAVKYSLHSESDATAFSFGYLSSLLATVASMSPAALQELERAVKYNAEVVGQ